MTKRVKFKMYLTLNNFGIITLNRKEFPAFPVPREVTPQQLYKSIWDSCSLVGLCARVKCSILDVDKQDVLNEIIKAYEDREKVLEKINQKQKQIDLPF